MSTAASAQRGFTLLEVLVALALMAVLATLSWRALDATARSSERLEAAGHDTLALMRTLGQLESDISRHAGIDVVQPETLLSSPSPFTEAARADRARAPGDRHTPAAKPSGGSGLLPSGLSWNPPRLAILRSAQDGLWQQVVWEVRGATLWRSAGEPARILPLPSPAANDPMLPEVDDFTIRAWVPGHGWADPVTTQSSVGATGLEITLLRHHEGRAESYRKVVLLP